MKKVLFIENHFNDFEVIHKELEDKFASELKIYPSIKDHSKFMDRIVKNEKDESEVLEDFKNFDLFIVDIQLINEDKLGYSICNSLVEEYDIDQENIIILTGLSEDKSRKYKDIKYIEKDKRSFTRAREGIVAFIEDRLSNNTINRGSNAKTKEENRLKKLVENLEQDSLRHIFMLLLYLTIFLSIIYAISKTSMDMYKGIFEGKDPLYICEHIFLYFLPFFIIYGFIAYFKSIIEPMLKGGKIDRDDKNNAIQSMHFTKTLFISSIMSYSIVKFLEGLNPLDFNLNSQILLGVIIIVMMVYLILHGKNH